jgi:hypothetical protein
MEMSGASASRDPEGEGGWRTGEDDPGDWRDLMKDLWRVPLNLVG